MLDVPNLAALRCAIEKIDLFGIRATLFYEPDHNFGLTAACTAPVSGHLLRVFRRFPLWQEATGAASARGPPDRPRQQAGDESRAAQSWKLSEWE
ncbi:MAG: hypothetical protein JXB07_12115 [Anaerolineae bacterium]|nr:hypothetical protein [Anaerolineae bacterium]